MAINSAYVLAGISAGGSSGADLGWFAPKGTTAPIDATTALASGTNEVQTVTTTGTPTGGTFTLSFNGSSTGAIAYNAAAAAVQSALQALASVGVGNVTVAGGPGPGTPYTVTFTGDLAQRNVPAMTASSAGLTGGTSPAIAVTTSTPGVRGFISAGLISEDGVAKGVKENSKDVPAYGLSVPVRKIVTSSEVTMKLTMLESNLTSLEVYNRYPLGSLNPINGALEVTEGTFRSQRYAFVADVVDGTNHIRMYCPDVEVTDRSDQQVKAGEAVTYEVSLTAYPGSDGIAVHTFYVVTGLV
jgi:hypothetical protein